MPGNRLRPKCHFSHGTSAWARARAPLTRRARCTLKLSAGPRDLDGQIRSKNQGGGGRTPRTDPGPGSSMPGGVRWATTGTCRTRPRRARTAPPPPHPTYLQAPAGKPQRLPSRCRKRRPRSSPQPCPSRRQLYTRTRPCQRGAWSDCGFRPRSFSPACLGPLGAVSRRETRSTCARALFRAVPPVRAPLGKSAPVAGRARATLASRRDARYKPRADRTAPARVRR